jgi:uncharacterized oligopeptide transporter (OPT) family protein
MANGIVAGQMAWPLVIAGMFMALGLILIKAPAPMLIAVGMYLPFSSTAAIFVGGVIKWIFDGMIARRKATDVEKTRAENIGILVSSGFIAGESLMAVLLALVVIAADRWPAVTGFQGLTFGFGSSSWLGLLIYPVMLFLLIWLPLSKMRDERLAAAKVTE